MALIVLASASGAPGVTTTALGLALTWPRPVVLVDADPVGGSAVLAGYFQGAVAPNDAAVELVLAHRDGRLSSALAHVLMKVPDTEHVWMLPGPRSHQQAASLADLWAPLGSELRGLEHNGQDVIVDAGRLGMMHSPTPLIDAADLALLVTRSDLPALAAARQWASDWSTAAAEGTGAMTVAGLLVGEGKPYRRGEVAKVLGIPMVESVAWDEQAAAVLSQGAQPPRRGMDASALVRSLHAVTAAVMGSIATARHEAAPARREGVLQ